MCARALLGPLCEGSETAAWLVCAGADRLALQTVSAAHAACAEYKAAGTLGDAGALCLYVLIS